ncbi:hypothetical protein PDL71_15780 [Lacibacter sp. MH-610]|uniref:GIY-YIG nuclease family protein n=1 Tax=Lacibacter sp. MH-610 TaxID=3020883 RepID=UPI003891DC7A
MQISVTAYLDNLLNELLSADRYKIILKRTWATQFPNTPGVYIFRLGDTVIYAGETGSIRGRMKDLIDTRNHTLRRSLGTKLYSDRVDFTKPSSKQRFCDAIEAELDKYISSNLTLSFIPVALGRKELEEKLFSVHSPEFNNKGLRITF